MTKIQDYRASPLLSWRMRLLSAASLAKISSWIFAHSPHSSILTTLQQFLLPSRHHFLHDFSTTTGQTTGAPAQKLGLILDNQLLCKAHAAAKS